MAKILVVEDEQEISNAYNIVLTGRGHQVFVAGNGDAGLLAVQQNQPDIIVLDMLMPGMSGLDFLRALDVKGNNLNTKVIAVTNIETPRVQSEAKELGVVKYVVKVEYTPAELAALIDQVLTAE